MHIHAHRGARGLRPENTLAALAYALRHGADGVEVDLCVTQDDEVVLHHDLRLNPDTTRNAAGEWIARRMPIRELRLRELRQYDVGRLKPGSEYAKRFCAQVAVDYARAPTLAECIQLFRRRAAPGVVLNLELKSRPQEPHLTPLPGEYVALVLEQLAQSGLSQHVFLQSFDWRLMRLVKKQRAELKTGMLTARTDDALPQAIADNGGDVWSSDYRHLTEALVTEAHRLGLEVCAWTVNTEPAMKRMMQWGVDVVTTDYPNAATGFALARG
ncbi:MAG: glycerophosphodiester phosphodiesterase family protein [Gammaproteobacteria bacterium]